MTLLRHLLTRTVIVAVLLATAAGCASGVAGTGSTGGGHRPADLPPDQIVFQVSSGGGFTTFAWALANRPELTVYADGTTYLSSATGVGGDGPRRFRVGHIGPAALSRLVAEAERSGVFDGADFGMPPISDVGNTWVRFRPDSDPARTADAYALSFDGDDTSLTHVQHENRVALRALITRMRHSVEITGDAYWTPSRVDVTEVDASGAGPAAPAWPGPALRSLLVKDDRGQCGELAGAAASTVWAAALRNGTGVWSETGADHHLVIRALLPGETPCAGVR